MDQRGDADATYKAKRLAVRDAGRSDDGREERDDADAHPDLADRRRAKAEDICEMSGDVALCWRTCPPVDVAQAIAVGLLPLDERKMAQPREQLARCRRSRRSARERARNDSRHCRGCRSDCDEMRRSRLLPRSQSNLAVAARR